MLWRPDCRMGPGRGWRLISIVLSIVHELVYEEDQRVDWDAIRLGNVYKCEKGQKSKSKSIHIA